MPALYKAYLVGGVSFRFIAFLFEEYLLSKHKKITANQVHALDWRLFSING